VLRKFARKKARIPKRKFFERGDRPSGPPAVVKSLLRGKIREGAANATSVKVPTYHRSQDVGLTAGKRAGIKRAGVENQSSKKVVREGGATIAPARKCKKASTRKKGLAV